MADMYFENLPSTNTPINADNLNKLNDIKVSVTEPTTGEKVWIKKGKNKLNISNIISQTMFGITISKNSDGTITLNGTASTSGNINLLSNISKEIKGTNTFSARIISGSISGSASFRISINDNANDSATSTEARIFSLILNSNTTTSSDIQENLNKEMFYLSIYINSGITFNNCKIALQVENGSTYSSYEQYAEEQIYILNNDNVYEKFNGIECGSNANGNYIKYANGLMICYNNVSLTVDITNSYEGEYYAATGDINFPVNFISLPTITTTLIQDSSLLRYNNSVLDTNRFSGYISKLESKSNVNIVLQYIAIGKWK